MSRSIHVTKRNFKGLSKKVIDEQSHDPLSDLSKWVDKLRIKKTERQNRDKRKELL